MSSPPSTLGQYQIIREIARSNDIVYEAYDPLMNRRVAVKELAIPPGLTPQQREDRISRFRREAQAAGTLNHPNIMTVYSFAEDAGRAFMAMEYLDGGTLRSELDSNGPMSVERAVEVATAILSGLEHAHAKGVIHRDIKPDNVQILSNGGIKITDFGIARLTFQPNLTMDGQVFGTPSYMSPEQVVGKEIDARSDLFSVGVVLYETLSGGKPFTGDSVVTITYGIMNKTPDRIHTLPPAMWDVVEKALEKSPAMRYGSAAEMISALENAVRVDAAPAPMVAPPVPGYGVNPYAPAPPPSAHPAAPQTTPYNPYGPAQGVPPAPPAANPYAGQYGQAAPAAAYPYNPYQGGGGAMPPHTAYGPGMPPPGPIPVYYPPPPRQPLLKPETTAFLKRLLLTVLILGTLFALVAVGSTALIQSVNRINAERELRGLRNSLLRMNDSVPISQQIAKWQQYRKALPHGANTAEADEHIAALYAKQADEFGKQSDYVGSEQSLMDAIANNPHDASLHNQYGNFFLDRTRALSADDYLNRADGYRHAAEEYRLAADQETDPSKRASELKASADCTCFFADYAMQANDPELMRQARSALESARVDVGDDTARQQQIESRLQQIGLRLAEQNG